MTTRFIYILLLACSITKAFAVNPTISYIRNSVFELLKDSKMNYESKLTMPDGTTQVTRGVMAYRGRNFYDSSANRFVLQNDKWYIGADHSDKTIKIIDMVAFRKENGAASSVGNVNILFDADSTLLNSLNLSVAKINQSESIVEIIFPGKTHLVKKLKIKFNLNSAIPVEYTGEIAYPLDYDTQINKKTGEEELVPTSYAQLSFACTDIIRSTPALFDHSRIIKNQNGKDIIVRYNNYETIYTKKLKK